MFIFYDDTVMYVEPYLDFTGEPALDEVYPGPPLDYDI